jgi:multiple sugar transport system substrate-binding protein
MKLQLTMNPSMNSFRRRRLMFAAPGAVVVAAAPRASRLPGVTLNIASFPDLDRGVQGALAAYRVLAPHVQIRVTALDTRDHHTAMISAMAAGANLPDLCAVDMDYIGKFAATGGLLNLLEPRFNAGMYRAQLPAFALAAATNRKGELAALPVDIGPGALFYRTDLMAAAGVTESDLTSSWDSFVDAGRRLKAQQGAYIVADAGAVCDIVIRADLADGEGVYFDAQGTPLVESARFVRAFELARSVRRHELDGRMNAWTNEWTEGLRRGRVATQMMGAWLAGHLKNWIAPEASGQWRSAQLPGSSFASWGGSFYGIPKGAANPDAAWDFLRFLTLDKAQQLSAFRALDAFPVLQPAQQDRFIDEPLPYLGGQRARQLWRTAAARIPAVAVDRYDAVAGQVVAAELSKVLVHDKDIRLALTDARQTLLRRVRRRR